MPSTTYDQLLQRACDFGASYPFWGEVIANVANAPTNQELAVWPIGDMALLPSPLPSGVGAYLLSRMVVRSFQDTLSFLVAKVVNLGSINIGTNVFTDGAVMPTVTELGVSTQVASGVILEWTTASGNSTPGTLSVTYKNQDGTAGQVSSAIAINSGSTPSLHSGLFLPLVSGDWGVQDITAVSQSGGTSPSGVLKFWGIIPLFQGPEGFTLEYGVNLLTNKFSLYRLGAGDKLKVFIYNSVAASAVTGDAFFIGDSA